MAEVLQRTGASRPGRRPLNVLALQLKRIGDLVLTTPALHALRAAGARVTLVLTDGTSALLPALADSVDEPLVYRTRGGNLALWKRLARGGFDACVDFTGRDRSALMTLAAHATRRAIAGQALRKGRWRRWVFNAVVDSSVRSRHTVDHYLDHLAALGLPYAFDEQHPAAPILAVPPANLARADALLAAGGIGAAEPFIVIHPGSARAEKYWQPERWAEIIRHCQTTRGLRCVLTGGNDPFEQQHLARIRAALSPADAASLLDLAGRLDLLTLTAILSRASLVLSVDSGPTHLAAAFRRPQTVLFGPTNPFHWRPRHGLARVLRAGHGDRPLTDFPERSPGGALDLISTRAVIDCIEELPPLADISPPPGPASVSSC